MTEFLIYQGKVAIALAVFYMFYRLLLSKDTFHRFNRIILIGTAALSFILPLCIITIRKTVTITTSVQQSFDFPISASGTALPVMEASTPWWPAVLCAIFAAGAICLLINTIISIIKIRQIIISGECLELESGEKLIVTETDTAPFSWMKYIVISREDHEGGYTQILTHEKAHIALRHSWDILFVDMITCMQWFNPAIWMLRNDLRAIHEFEADDAVLRSGTNVKDYQYLLIRKAVGKSGYSVANSFNHSTLKQRITMMSIKKSSRTSAWKALYIIPLVGISLAATAETKVDYRYAEPEAQSDTTARKVTSVTSENNEDSEKNWKKQNSSALAIIPDENAKTVTIRYINSKLEPEEKVFSGLDFSENVWLCNHEVITKELGEQMLKQENVVYGSCSLSNGKMVNLVILPTLEAKLTPIGEAENSAIIGNGSVTIRYRGEDGATQPLIVVDGEPMPKDFDMKSLETGNIEAINVLKDEEAINKYGLPEAINGVVEIWLKWERNHDPDEPVRFIPVSEPVGDVKEYYGFKLYDAHNWNKKISYKDYKSLDNSQLDYCFIEHIGNGKKILHVYTLDYNTGIHLSKCKKTEDYYDEALNWVNEKTQILINGKWQNYEGYLRTRKFRIEDVKEIEYYKYPERRVKRLNLRDNGFVNVIYKTDYDKEIILTM